MIKSLQLAALAFVLSGATAAPAQDYSAEAVAHNMTGQSRTMKVFVSQGKIRVEPVGALSYEILDTAKQTGYFVIPGKKLAVLQPPAMVLQNGTSYSVGATPCSKVAPPPSPPATCKKLGMDKVNGRPAEKWQLTQGNLKQNFTSTVWVDRQLDAVVKAQSPRGTFALQNLHFGPQSANLFTVPAGFTTKTIAGMQRPVTLKGPSAGTH
ncbi:MAG TPA: hypothetical protein VII49_00175 [Rhizomicrobium sp.]